jgi:hypothetical protein
MSPKDEWNPDDGPPPDEREREDARALEVAMGESAQARKKRGDADLDAIIDTALRVRATAHPDAERTRSIAAEAVDYAITHAGQRWYRTRWRWLALVAAAVLGVGGIQLTVFRSPVEEQVPVISHAGGDVLRAPVPDDARSSVIDRLADARMHAYRDVLFHAGRRSP